MLTDKADLSATTIANKEAHKGLAYFVHQYNQFKDFYIAALTLIQTKITSMLTYFQTEAPMKNTKIHAIFTTTTTPTNAFPLQIGSRLRM